MSEIIAFVGKKQSGKNTACNFITLLKLLEYGVCKGGQINNRGEIEVTDIFGETCFAGEHKDKKYFPLNTEYVNIDALNKEINFVKQYSFAEDLKLLCIKLLGLRYEQVFGTDEEKNSLTELKWENMPGVTTELSANKNEDIFVSKASIYHSSGQMTARQVLQFIGTEIFRKMKDDVWINALMKKIQDEHPDVALISDCRFPNEMEAIKKLGGKLIGLTRNYTSIDNHESEKITYDYCDIIIDNKDMTIPEQNEAIYKVLIGLGCKNIPKI